MSNRNQFTIPGGSNGDTTIGFTSVKKMQNLGYMDKANFSSYINDDNKGHVKHLGLVNLYAHTHNTPIPFLRDLFKNSAVLEVEEGQTITYDLPVNRSNDRCLTQEDTSDYQDQPGIDGAVFQIVLNGEYTGGDLLSYDLQHGEQIMVSMDHPVELEGENYKHWVTYWTNDKNAWYPKDKLKAGIQYFKITNALAEYDTTFSGVNMSTPPAGTITNEFLLGSPRGVEAFMTREASRMKTPAGMAVLNDKMMNNVYAELEALGGTEASMFYIGASRNGSISSNMMVGTTMEYLVMMELAKMEAYSLLFARAGTQMTANGVKRITEGAWHQLRRGKTIEYSREGGITIDHIREAASYVYRNNTSIPIDQRFIKFKCGYFAHMNWLQLTREFAVRQLEGLPAGMLGMDGQLGQKVFSGPLGALKMEYVAIQDVFVPGVGRVIAEHDPSLDYEPFSDRFSSGAFGQTMMAHTSYSMVIWDLKDSQYSNVSKADNVKGAKLMEGTTPKSNIFYVKPEGAAVTFGYEQGRMADKGNYANVVSSMPQMGKKIWALSQSGVLMLDTTAYVVIEKKR